MIRKVAHIGIAVKSIDEAEKFYVDTLGLKKVGEESIGPMNLRLSKIQAGDVVLELLEPENGERVVSKFLKERGEGIHHICFEVADVAGVSRRWKTIWPEPRRGMEGTLVNFIHPKDAHGVLIEFSEASK